MERKAYVKTPFDNMLKVFLVPNGNPKKNAYILFDKEKCDGVLLSFPIISRLDHRSWCGWLQASLRD